MDSLVLSSLQLILPVLLGMHPERGRNPFFIIVDQYYKVKSLRLIVTPCETTILPVMIPAEARKQTEGRRTREDRGTIHRVVCVPRRCWRWWGWDGDKNFLGPSDPWNWEYIANIILGEYLKQVETKHVNSNLCVLNMSQGNATNHTTYD